MRKEYIEDLQIFKAISDKRRLSILEFLKSGEKCACELMDFMGIGQSAISYHMKILCISDIVSCRKDGKWTYYSLSKSGRDRAISRLRDIITPISYNKKAKKCD